jgi:hypothetical protein
LEKVFEKPLFHKHVGEKMDIDEIMQTFDRLHGFKKFVENEHDFGLKAKDFEIAAICLVCDRSVDNLTIDFMPWIEALEIERGRNPGNFEIILKRDRSLTLPKPCVDLSGNPFKLSLALKSLDDEEYKNFRDEFINVLDILYHASESLYHDAVIAEEYPKSEKYPYPLPYHGDVDDIGNIFGKSF